MSIDLSRIPISGIPNTPQSSIRAKGGKAPPPPTADRWGPYHRPHPPTIISIMAKHSLDLAWNVDPKIAKMTADLLYYRGTITEVLRSSEFHKKVIECIKKSPFVLAPHYLRHNQYLNKTYLSLKYMRLGHVFNIDEMIRLPDGTRIRSVDGYPTYLLPMLQAAFTQFALARKDIINNKIRDSITESLSRAIWRENASDKQIDEIHTLIHATSYPHAVIVGSGCSSHSIQTIFYKIPSGAYYVCHGNRGRGCEKESGIVIFEVDKKKITKEFIKHLVERSKGNEDQYINRQKLKGQLGGTQNNYLYMKTQKEGNCVYASYKAVFFALLFIAAEKENPRSAKTIAKQLYKEFSQFEATIVLEDFLIDLREHNKIEALPEEYKNYIIGLRHICILLEKYLKRICHSMDMGEKKKIPYDLAQTALKAIEIFEHARDT